MLITLTTDFGYKDPFVGIMKGVIIGLNPSARIVDITHGITPHNIQETALTIVEIYPYFPANTIHVVVVDPGVGGPRRPILVEAGNQYFIGPDNGIFSLIYKANLDVMEVVHLNAEHYFMDARGSTFHGRDVFAPVAGWLSKGISIDKLGDRIKEYATIEIPSSFIEGREAFGEVLYLDHFGNAITNIKRDVIETLLNAGPAGKIEIDIQGRKAELKSYYSHALSGTLSSVINSGGFVEVFLFEGNASEMFGIKPGDKVKASISR